MCTAEESAKLLADTMFPEDNTETDLQEHRNLRESIIRIDKDVLGDDDLPFSQEELRHAYEKFSPQKAPGNDGLTADICNKAISIDGGVFLELANVCLRQGYFPIMWKKAVACIIPKPGKDDYSNPKAYRPIGLLSILGKTLERLLVGRLKWHFLSTLNCKQYGFMPQRSTEDSLYDAVTYIKTQLQDNKICVLVSLDIEGAFDGVWWPIILQRLIEKRCPANIFGMVRSYLCDREVEVTYLDKTYKKVTNRGCVQGSIAGPTFWNLILDPLLNNIESMGVYGQAFADDIILIFSATQMDEIEQRANQTLEQVDKWGTMNKLKFAPHKSNAMLITKKRNIPLPEIKLNEQCIGFVEQVRVLGVLIDNKLKFSSHVEAIQKKAIKIYKQLERAAKITWGLNPSIIRVIYQCVIEPIILYAASVWEDVLNKKYIQRRLWSLQRHFAVKIGKGYRTLSFEAALAIAGLIPLDLRVSEAAKLFKIKRGDSLTEDGTELECRVPYALNPHPAKCNLIEYFALEEITDSRVDELQIKGLHVYTDGSKVDGKVGAAFSVWRDNREIEHRTIKLAPCCSVYQAELLAILRATEIAETLQTSDVNIFSDSKSSLDAIIDYTSSHPVAFNIRYNINELQLKGINLRLFWLRAHIGTPGNERADELAKRAAVSDIDIPEYSQYPLTYAKQVIRSQSLQKWNNRYIAKTYGKIIQVFLPDVYSAYKFAFSKEPDGLLTQALTGHGGLSQYLHRFRIKSNPWCICEPGIIEDVPHVLVDCPRFAVERLNTEIKLGSKIYHAVFRDLLIGKKSGDIFIEFIRNVIRKVCKTNGSTARWL